MTSKRWYPTVETLEDGSVIVIGGDINGGYVNDQYQDNPTYEFFPHKGSDEPINLQWLSDTLPINLYPLTWLMPSGKLFMQANRKTMMYDWRNRTTTDLPDMPFAARVYPASAATAMLPLTPDNNYTPTILFCGGSNPPQWGDGIAGYNVSAVEADNSCVRISPEDNNPTYVTDDYMFEGRSMGEFVFLPDGTLWMGNGVGYGTAGYGSDKWSVGSESIPAQTTPCSPSQNLIVNTRSRSARARANARLSVLRPRSPVHARHLQPRRPRRSTLEPHWTHRRDQRTNVPLYRDSPSRLVCARLWR